MAVHIKWDEAALKKAVEDSFNEYAFSGDLEYPCPECDSPIPIAGPVNRCKCGFTLNVELGELQL